MIFDQDRYIAPLKPNINSQDLPMGKYIVCGEAHKEGHVVQANCFETIIDRLDNNSELLIFYFQDSIHCIGGEKRREPKGST